MDFVLSEVGVEPIVVEGLFDTSPDKMFEAWTDPLIVKQWFGLEPNSLHSASIDLRVGGKWQFIKTCNEVEMVGFEGEYLAIEPTHLLKFSWALVTTHADGRRDSTPFSQVEIHIQQQGSLTHVRLIHSGIASEPNAIGFGKGWNIALNSLSSMLSTRDQSDSNGY